MTTYHCFCAIRKWELLSCCNQNFVIFPGHLSKIYEIEDTLYGSFPLKCNYYFLLLELIIQDKFQNLLALDIIWPHLPLAMTFFNGSNLKVKAITECCRIGVLIKPYKGTQIKEITTEIQNKNAYRQPLLSFGKS